VLGGKGEAQQAPRHDLHGLKVKTCGEFKERQPHLSILSGNSIFFTGNVHIFGKYAAKRPGLVRYSPIFGEECG
jgi:hypothetical protein